jgi:hypothetical protein
MEKQCSVGVTILTTFVAVLTTPAPAIWSPSTAPKAGGEHER